MPLIARRVCIESPLRGEVSRNVSYADACMLDALRRGEAPFLGHLLYPRVLDDARPEDRDLGIAAHIAWLRFADMLAVYSDRGIHRRHAARARARAHAAHTHRVPAAWAGLVDTLQRRRAHDRRVFQRRTSGIRRRRSVHLQSRFPLSRMSGAPGAPPNTDEVTPTHSTVNEGPHGTRQRRSTNPHQ